MEARAKSKKRQIGLIGSGSSHPDWDDRFIHVHRVHDIEVVLDAGVGEGEAFV
jgi:hypothetical protein